MGLPQRGEHSPRVKVIGSGCRGKLCEHWATRDDLSAMLQLGVVQPPGPPPGVRESTLRSCGRRPIHPRSTAQLGPLTACIRTVIARAGTAACARHETGQGTDPSSSAGNELLLIDSLGVCAHATVVIKRKPPPLLCSGRRHLCLALSGLFFWIFARAVSVMGPVEGPITRRYCQALLRGGVKRVRHRGRHRQGAMLLLKRTEVSVTSGRFPRPAGR